MLIRSNFGCGRWLCQVVALPLLAVGAGTSAASAAERAAVSRLIAAGTAVSLEVDAQVDIADAGFVRVAGGQGVFAPKATISEAAGGHGVVALTTLPTLSPGKHQGDVALQWCRDSSCAAGPVAGFSVQYELEVVAAHDAWPGNHLTALPLNSRWPEWSQFQGNAAHTGYVPARLDPSKFSTRWQMPIQPVQGWLIPGVPSIASSGGLLYVSGGGKLNVFNEGDASPVWTHDFGNLPYPSVNPPAVGNGAVYLAVGNQNATYFFAFDALSGSQVFQSPMSSQWDNYFAPTIGVHGIYTNAGTYGGLYGFARSGAELFAVFEQQQSLWTPAVDGSGVYSYTGFLQVVDPRTGVETHNIADPTFQNYTYIIGGAPVLGAPGSVFVANYTNAQLNGGGIGNTLLNFSIDSDSIAWQVAGDYPTTPGYAAGQVYAPNNKPLRLEVRAETDGTLAWSWTPPAGDRYFVSEALLTRNLVFVSTNVATYAISLKSHRAVWSYPLTGKLALSKSGILYIQGATTLSAFNVL